jgi:hypothetical protein
MLPYHSLISKKGISATLNVLESLVFSGFLDILFMPFVSIKRFTFQYSAENRENRSAGRSPPT